jgi:hypothetical protein
MAVKSPKNNKPTRKPKTKNVSDCLIVTYPDGTENLYNKGENCKGWKEIEPTGMPIFIIYFIDNSFMRFVGYPYRIISYGKQV